MPKSIEKVEFTVFEYGNKLADFNAKYKDSREPFEEIDWVDYFLGLAYAVSRRSKDAQTKHGCIITDIDHNILGTGYNSFAKKLPDNILPNLRPAKYPFFSLHSEVNAISRCTVSPLRLPDGGVAYITGRPCFSCLQLLWNNNIKTIYCVNSYGWSKDAEEKENFEFFVAATGINIWDVEPDLDWLDEVKPKKPLRVEAKIDAPAADKFYEKLEEAAQKLSSVTESSFDDCVRQINVACGDNSGKPYIFSPKMIDSWEKEMNDKAWESFLDVVNYGNKPDGTKFWNVRDKGGRFAKKGAKPCA